MCGTIAPNLFKQAPKVNRFRRKTPGGAAGEQKNVLTNMRDVFIILVASNTAKECKYIFHSDSSIEG